MGVPGEKKGESDSQEIKGESVESPCLWRDEMIISLWSAAWRSRGLVKFETPTEEAGWRVTESL